MTLGYVYPQDDEDYRETYYSVGYTNDQMKYLDPDDDEVLTLYLEPC